MIIVKDDLYNHYEDFNDANIQLALTEISRYRFLTDFAMQKIFLDNYLIIYVTQGEVVIKVDKEIIALTDKSLMLVPPYRMIQMYGNGKKDTIFYTLDFSCNQFVFFELIKYVHIKSAGMIEVPITELYSSFASGTYYNFIKDAKLLIILTIISELLKPKSGNRQLVEKVIEYINENIMLQIDLDTLSEELSYNKDYLGRAFKKEMGMSINKFINSEKINMSKKLLDNSDMSISAIANALGWDDPNKFLKFFKYHENITPSQYREKKYSD